MPMIVIEDPRVVKSPRQANKCKNEEVVQMALTAKGKWVRTDSTIREEPKAPGKLQTYIAMRAKKLRVKIQTPCQGGFLYARSVENPDPQTSKKADRK